MIKRSLIGLFLFLCCNLALADDALSLLGIHSTQSHQPLPAAEAFQLHTETATHEVILSWKIAEHYYLYQNRIKLELTGADQAQIGAIEYPVAQIVNDAYFGKVKVYYNQLQLTVPIHGKIKPDTALKVTWQGCSGSLCYPKQNQVIPLYGSALQSSALPSANDQAAQQPSGNQASNEPTQVRLKRLLTEEHPALSLLILYGIGLLLSLTPCVLPMLPVLSGIILGQEDRSTTHAFALAISYVLGMALVYTLMGIAIVQIGVTFQSWFQQPGVILLSAGLLVLLGLWMLDVFTQSVGNNVNNKLMQWQAAQHHSSFLGLFLVGVLSALILSPCTSAPLIGVLGFISQSQNLLFGGLALFIMALGMGTPLVLFSVGAGTWLPKSGTWMVQIKRFFGFLLFAVALYLIARIVPMHWILVLSGGLLLMYAQFLGGLWGSAITLFQKFARGLAWILTVYGAILMLGGFMGHTHFLQPLADQRQADSKALSWKTVYDLDALKAALENNPDKQPILIDFYADWCIECHKMAATTFRNADVQKALNHYRLIKADVTRNSVKADQLMQHYEILGLPTMLILNPYRSEQQRLVGDQSAEQLLQALSLAESN